MIQTGSFEDSLAFNHVLRNRNSDTHRHYTNIDQYIHRIISPQKPAMIHHHIASAHGSNGSPPAPSQDPYRSIPALWVSPEQAWD
jgi:hypothetical protein